MKDNVLPLQLHQQEKAVQHLDHLVEMELGKEQPPATSNSLVQYKLYWQELQNCPMIRSEY
jgi:hypothetical protein